MHIPHATRLSTVLLEAMACCAACGFIFPTPTRAEGNNLWNIRLNGDDRFHSNEAWLRPWRNNYDDGWGRWVGNYSYHLHWSGPYTQSSGSCWTIDANGDLTVHGRRDLQWHGWTHVYVDSPTSLHIPGGGDCVPKAFLNCAFDSPINFPGPFNLNAGWNRIDITGYNQNDSYTFRLNYALANNVDHMNSEPIDLNDPPAAVCQDTVLALDDKGQAVLEPSDVDGGSSDPDGDPISLGVDRTTFSCDDLGDVVVTLTVTDDSNASDQCTATVTVVDNASPSLDCPGAMTVSADADCQAPIPDLSGSLTLSDNCTPNASLTIVQNPPAGTVVPLGDHTITVTVTDSAGNSSTCTTTVTVADDKAPIVDSFVTSEVLWPPSHLLMNVGLGATTNDNCNVENISVAVFGDEDDAEATNGAIRSPDAADIGLDTLQLRAECNRKGDGRVYLIVVTATDASGNVGHHCCSVVVPLSMRPADIADVQAQATAAVDYCLATGEAPTDYFVIGDGPQAGATPQGGPKAQVRSYAETEPTDPAALSCGASGIPMLGFIMLSLALVRIKESGNGRK